MTTIECSYKDLCKLIGKKIPLKKLEEEDILFVKGEIESIDGDTLKIELPDSNRPDLWSTEGIARELKGKYELEKGVPKITVKKNPKHVVNISKDLKSIRPLISCAVVKNVKVTNEFIVQLIQLQEKLAEGFGRKRKEAAIGVYDYDKITWPVNYVAADPDKTKFIPLEMDKELTLRQILSKHPKGRDYAKLIEGFKKYPLIIDSNNEVLSMPPVINSNHTGKVTEKTKNFFIEVTGFDWRFVNTSLLVMVQALSDRGFNIESVTNVYSDKKNITPDFSSKKSNTTSSFINNRLGLNLSDSNISKLLKMARYDVSIKNKKISVSYPAYRQDILHESDIAEDVCIFYGFNNFVPETKPLATVGKIQSIETFSRKASELLVGLGSQEIMSYTLTNEEHLVKKMNIKNEQTLIEIENYVSKNWNCFRNWIIPGLLEFLSKNKNREYPQNIFEIGNVVIYDDKKDTMTDNPVRLAWAKIDKKIDYTGAKQALDFLLSNLGLESKIAPVEHDSFISGRVGRVLVDNKKVGFIGEMHPTVLRNFDLDMPVSCFEINLTELNKILKRN